MVDYGCPQPKNKELRDDVDTSLNNKTIHYDSHHRGGLVNPRPCIL